MSEAVQEFLADETPETEQSGPREMNPFEFAGAAETFNAIQAAADNTDRAQQQREFVLGVSNLGHCRQHAVLTIRQTPPSDVRNKTAAFIGRVLGEAIEKQMKIMHPEWHFQSEVTLKFKSGGEVDGHFDCVIPAEAGVTPEEAERGEGHVQGVWDFKSKDKLDIVKRMGMTQQQRYQLMGYADAAIDEGLLDPTKPIWCQDIYFDRSGASEECYAIGFWYNPDDMQEIDEWVGDVIYAAAHGEDASRDLPREFCWKYCEYATICRGNDTDVEGLITDPEIRTAIDMYREGQDKVNEGDKLKKQAKAAIPAGLAGSTGRNNIRWIHVNESERKASTVKAYDRISITAVPGPKGAKK